MADTEGACGMDPDAFDDESVTPPSTPSGRVSECPACTTLYNSTTNRPKLLLCDHTMCKACILTHTKEIVCPVCTHVTRLSDGNMQTDFMTLQGVADPDLDGVLQSSLGALDISSPNADDDTDAKSPAGSSPAHSAASAKQSRSDSSYAEEMSWAFQSTSQTNADMVQELLRGQFAEAMQSAASRLDTLQLQSELLCASRDFTVALVDREFDHLAQVIHRRRQLIKNQVEDIYAELQERLQEDIERLNLNSMCLSSLKQHSRLVMREDGERLQGSYHQIASEITELQENIDQVLPDNAVCIKFDIKDKVKDFERSVRTLGKVQTGTNIPTKVVIVDQKAMVNEESCLFIHIQDAGGENLTHTFQEGTLEVQLSAPNGDIIEAHLSLVSSHQGSDPCFMVNFVPLLDGQHSLIVLFCDKELPSSAFTV